MAPTMFQLGAICFSSGIVAGIGLAWLIVIRHDRQTINQLAHALQRAAKTAKEIAETYALSLSPKFLSSFEIAAAAERNQPATYRCRGCGDVGVVEEDDLCFSCERERQMEDAAERRAERD